jgi:uncharacterized protein (TIGR03000 family)
MSQRLRAALLAAALATGALACFTPQAEARPRGGRGGGRVGVRAGGFRGRPAFSRGFRGRPVFSRGFRGRPVFSRGFRVYRPFYGYGLGLGYWGGYPYYNYSYGYTPGYASSYYVPDTTTYSSYYSPSTAIEDTEAPADDRAHLLFIVPENASVVVEGDTTASTGPEREFVSPPLVPGKRYVYTVRVYGTTDDGRAFDETRTIRVWAGARWRVDFTQPAR